MLPLIQSAIAVHVLTHTIGSSAPAPHPPCTQSLPPLPSLEHQAPPMGPPRRGIAATDAPPPPPLCLPLATAAFFRAAAIVAALLCPSPAPQPLPPPNPPLSSGEPLRGFSPHLEDRTLAIQGRARESMEAGLLGTAVAADSRALGALLRDVTWSGNGPAAQRGSNAAIINVRPSTKLSSHDAQGKGCPGTMPPPPASSRPDFQGFI